MKMIDVNYTDYDKEAELTLSYTEINYIVQFLCYYDCYEAKEKINKEILPKLREFLAENY